MSKQLVTTTEKMPAYLKNVQDDTRGNENVTKDDLIIPRLSIIQALSPEIKKKDPAYIEGAEQGQLFNTVTREVYGESVTVVPVYFEKVYLVWKDRQQGGGFGGQYQTQEEANGAIAEMNEDGWEVVDTPTHVCLVISDSGVSEIAIPLPKSKARISRQWNSLVRMLGGPRFSRAYAISGVEDSSDLGDFWNFKVAQAGFPSEEVFRKAEEFYNELTSGDINYSVDQGDTDEAHEDTSF